MFSKIGKRNVTATRMMNLESGKVCSTESGIGRRCCARPLTVEIGGGIFVNV